MAAIPGSRPATSSLTSAFSISSAAICGRESVEADGVNLRVLRRADGTLEIADLVRPEEKRPDHPDAHRDAGPLIVHDPRRQA